jgi:hypothetical protein
LKKSFYENFNISIDKLISVEIAKVLQYVKQMFEILLSKFASKQMARVNQHPHLYLDLFE